MPKPIPNQEDEDPTPYLFVSLEQKRIDQAKPYDSKKACWIPDDKEGYLLGDIKATKGDIVSVALVGGDVSIRTRCAGNIGRMKFARSDILETTRQTKTEEITIRKNKHTPFVLQYRTFIIKTFCNKITCTLLELSTVNKPTSNKYIETWAARCDT